MGFIERFTEILDDSRLMSERAKVGNFEISEEINCADFANAPELEENDTNIMAFGDNAAFMKYLINKKGMSGKINLIYIDPPFFSKAAYDAVINLKSPDGKEKCSAKYFAYDDIWQGDMAEYLKMLCPQ